MKLWVLAEVLTGYCLRFQIYTGTCGDKTEHSLSHRVVMDLMEQYYHKNHHVYFENFYSSPKLLKDLAAKDTFACGTIRIDHGLFSDDFKYSKLAVGDSIFIYKIILYLSIGRIRETFSSYFLYTIMNVLMCQREQMKLSQNQP